MGAEQPPTVAQLGMQHRAATLFGLLPTVIERDQGLRPPVTPEVRDAFLTLAAWLTKPMPNQWHRPIVPAQWERLRHAMTVAHLHVADAYYETFPRESPASV